MIEAFIANYLAPEVLSNQGRALILVAWVLMIGFSLIGASQMKMDFSMEYFLVPDQPVTEFIHLNNKYFQEGSDFEIYHKLDLNDVSSEEMQYKILDFQERLYKCYLCNENWLQKQLVWDLWYSDFNDFVREGQCMLLPSGLTPFEKTVPPEIFYFCIHQAIREKKCNQCKDRI